MIDDKKVEHIYKEYWNHVRHVEWQRMAFTTAFTLTVGTIIGFIIWKDTLVTFESGIILTVFLIGFSIMGFLISYKSAIAVFFFSYAADLIALNRWKIPDSFLLHKRPVDKKGRISIASIFATYYTVLISGFIGSLVYWIIPDQFLSSIIIGGLFFLLSCIILMSLYHKTTSRIILHMKNQMDESQNDFKHS